MVINQYDILLVNLDPTQGSEIKKTRPCVVISPNEMNFHLNTIIIAPLTSTTKTYPTRIPINFQNKKGAISIDQIRTIDKRRVLKVMDQLDQKLIIECKNIIRETFVD